MSNAIQKNTEGLRSKSGKQTVFLEELECEIATGKMLCSQSLLRQGIANFCLLQYNNICSEKERQLKSLKHYENIWRMEMAEEAIKQLCAERYNKTFLLLASLNQHSRMLGFQPKTIVIGGGTVLSQSYCAYSFL